MRKSAMLTVILLILILICFGKIGKGILENRIAKETILEAEYIETNEQSNESDIFFQIAEEQEMDFSRSSLQEETIIQTIGEQETDLSKKSLQDEAITESTEPVSVTVTSSVGRVLTNELCTGMASEIFEQTNSERVAEGLEPLVWDDELARCADIRAEEILTNFSHIRDDGTKCYALSELIWGENIAKSPPDANGNDFVVHWMESDGHRANILNAQYTTIGIGIYCVKEGYTAVQLFGIDTIQ